MPFDTTDYERSLIGAICRDQGVIRLIMPLLRREDFSFTPCALVYDAACKADAEGRLFDGILASEALAGKLEEPRRFIAECMDFCPTTANAEVYAEALHRHAEHARLSSAVIGLLAVPPEEGVDLAAELMALCSEHIQARPSNRMRSLADVLDETFRAQFDPDEARVDTGYPRLDEVLMGMHADELIIIGARPAVGKTAFAISLAEHAATAGKLVQIYSLEMSEVQMGERFLARGAKRVGMNELINRAAANDEASQQDLGQTVIRLGGLPIQVNDSPRTTVSRIRSQAFAARGVGLIIVDYAGLMEPERGGSKPENRNQELGAISRALKLLAKELKIPVVLLAQLSRKTDDNERPSLAALRDSGELEQNADKVIFLWNIDRERHIVGVSVAKTRRGRLGAVRMQFDGEKMRFTEMGEPYEEPRRRRGWYREEA